LAATGGGEYGTGNSPFGQNADDENKREVLTKLGMGDQLMLGDDDVLNDEVEDVKPVNTSGIKRELSPSAISTRKTAETGFNGAAGKPNKRLKRAEGSNVISRPASPVGPPQSKVVSDMRPSGNIADDPLFAGISARQINVLKRKMKTGLPYHLAVEEAAR
jgi:hypothetical protein